jgi:hypothetical protein
MNSFASPKVKEGAMVAMKREFVTKISARVCLAGMSWFSVSITLLLAKDVAK